MALNRWIKLDQVGGPPGDTEAHASIGLPMVAPIDRAQQLPYAANEHASTMEPGWLVAYHGPDGRLRGGCDDRDHGTIREERLSNAGSSVILTDGTVVPARAVYQSPSTEETSCRK